MKKSVVMLLCLVALTACKKNETTASDTSADTTSVMAAPDSATTPTDSLTLAAPGSLDSMSAGDRTFADDAARGGMLEVMLGELARTNGSRAEVKDLGAMMVRDHGKANEELKGWATAIGYTLPTALNADQQKTFDGLKARTGADFDRAYAAEMVKDHKKDLEKFRKQAAEGAENGLKSFAGKTVPTLEHHLSQSEETQKAVK